MKRTALLMAGVLRRATIPRFVCGALGGVVLSVVLPALVLFGALPPVIAAGILPISLLGELLERYFFSRRWFRRKCPEGLRHETGHREIMATSARKKSRRVCPQAEWQANAGSGIASRQVYVEMNSLDAEFLGIEANQQVLIASRGGHVTATVFITNTVQAGQLFIPMHYSAANELTFPAFDPYSRQPAYKACAVSVMPL
jgi:formylmethanofuran dehydrogenase subunit D